MTFMRIFVALVAFLFATSASAASLFAVSGNNQSIVEIDATTGAKTLLGATGLPGGIRVGGAAVDPTGSLFVSATNGDLYKIAVGTPDGILGTPNTATLVGDMGIGSAGLAFAADGTLYNVFGANLFTVDSTTGASRALGGPDAFRIGAGGLTVAPKAITTRVGTFAAGTLFFTNLGMIYAVDVAAFDADPVANAPTFVGQSLPAGFPAASNSVAFTADGRLWGADFTGNRVFYEINLNPGLGFGQNLPVTELTRDIMNDAIGLTASAPFQTQAAVIPLPASLPLLAAGVALFGFMKRRSSRKTA